MTDTATQTEPTPEPDLSGRQIGDYLLLRRLGRGGMAEVYLAQQNSLDRPVAFKVLKHSLAGDESYVRRFHHEARAAATLVQANIVQIYEVGEIEGIHFIAQEYVQGQNAKQYLNRHGAMDVFLAINIMRQVAAALHKAAEQGVIHRDIKPENIMIAANGEVKVADFGLARITRQDKANDMTQIGITMGTPLYMSPEQVEGAKVDPRSDIYSFGVTSYELLAGNPPFDGDTALAVAVKHLNDEPLALENSRPDIPQELCTIIHKMMAKGPEDRFQSPAELLRDLRAIQIEESDETWAETIEQLSLIDTQVLAPTKTRATERLGALMREQQRRLITPIHWIAIAAIGLAIGGFSVGAAYSLVNPPEDLLHVERSELEQVPNRETAEEQYRLAYQLRSERAWQAVGENFDPNESSQNRYYARLADLRLGELYLQQERYEDALAMFEGLRAVEDSDLEFQLVGLAGTAISHAALNNEPMSRQVMVEFDDRFEEYSQTVRGGPRNWSEFFADNDLIRGRMEQLREELNWPDGNRRPPIDTLGS